MRRINLNESHCHFYCVAESTEDDVDTEGFCTLEYTKVNDFAYKSMLIYLARLNILEAFSTEFQTASESDKKKITKYLIDHIRNPLRELASKIVIEDETAEKKAHLDYEQRSPIKYGMFIFERKSGCGVRVFDLCYSEPGCLVEKYGLERFTKAFKIFPKDVSELSNSAKDKLLWQEIYEQHRRSE